MHIFLYLEKRQSGDDFERFHGLGMILECV